MRAVTEDWISVVKYLEGGIRLYLKENLSAQTFTNVLPDLVPKSQQSSGNTETTRHLLG